MYPFLICFIYIVAPVIIVYAYPRCKIVRKMGSVILAYTVGIIMALTGFVFFEDGSSDASAVSSIQKIIQSVAVPLAIPLMLFNCDFKLWTKSLPKTVAALGGGLAAIIIAIISGFFIFRHLGISDFPQVAGMLTGIYTGGTMNFFALGNALHVNGTIMTLTYTFEMVITFPLIMFIVGGGYKLFRKILPYRDESSLNTTAETPDSESPMEENGIENYRGMLKWKTFSKTLMGLLLSAVFMAVGAGISLLITGKINELAVILTITTLAICASFFKKVRELPRTFELGMVFILIFSVVVASQFDIETLDRHAADIGKFILYVMLTTTTLHILFSRLLKVSGDLYTVSLVGLFCSPPFIPPVVSAMGNKKVLISGIVIGLIGYAIGTYLGIAICWLLTSL